MNDETVTNASSDDIVILIVDDEPDITTTYTMLFEHYGYSVRTASDGKDALKIIDAVAPDVIISDYMMPLMTGAELCTVLKNNLRWKDTPFILVSAAFHVKDIDTPYDLLMQKPVAFNALLKEIQRLLMKKS
ncbi:MAG: response regulator [Gammaproteobacteria bacterium]|nr:MAG: response regulator [Gammaproteobacteria bacterium]